VGGPIFGTNQQLHYPFDDLAVLRSENTSDKKSIVHSLSLKKFFCGVYIRKGVRSFWGIVERKKQ